MHKNYIDYYTSPNSTKPLNKAQRLYIDCTAQYMASKLHMNQPKLYYQFIIDIEPAELQSNLEQALNSDNPKRTFYALCIASIEAKKHIRT